MSHTKNIFSRRAIFFGTIIPIMPFIEHYGPFYIPFMGEYGTTYTINLYV